MRAQPMASAEGRTPVLELSARNTVAHAGLVREATPSPRRPRICAVLGPAWPIALTRPGEGTSYELTAMDMVLGRRS